jgi:hypothetical protein
VEKSFGDRLSVVKEKKHTFNLNLPQNAVDDLRKYCGETRVQKAVLAQLVVWFTAQPAAVQRVVMGEVTEGMEEDYARALESLAVKVRTGAKKRA